MSSTGKKPTQKTQKGNNEHQGDRRYEVVNSEPEDRVTIYELEARVLELSWDRRHRWQTLLKMLAHKPKHI